MNKGNQTTANYRVKPIADFQGVFRRAHKLLPVDLQDSFLAALAELQDNECHRTRSFPVTRLHALSGVSTPEGKTIYRADVSKTSGWRLHVLYGDDGFLYLADLLEGKLHDSPTRDVKRKKGRYKLG